MIGYQAYDNVCLKLVSAILCHILSFHQMIALQKLENFVYLFHLKSSFCSRDIQFFVIFFTFHTSQIQKDKWKWNNL